MQRPPETREEVPFDHDVETMGSYVYTRGTQLSNRLGMERQSRAIYEATAFAGASVIDIGCGDGAATINLYDDCAPARITAIDPAAKAIAAAEVARKTRNIHFAALSAYDLPYDDNAFDIALMRGVLHHMDRPERAIEEAARVAGTVVVLEPNGYNPMLKIIEKTSRYHIEHGERSYAPSTVDGWLRQAGLVVKRREFCGLVPYFCSDRLARLLRWCEPLVEGMPVLRTIGCGTYVGVGVRPARAPA